MDLRLTSAIFAAKTLRTLLRATGSGATAAPGLAANSIDPNVLKKLAKNYSEIILISGTNGKTTTSRLLSGILNQAGIAHIDNREGSNLVRGLTSSLMQESSFFGHPRARCAVFEVDEAALPVVISQLHPRIIVLNNLFRDQLDRYGEVDTIRKLWQKAIMNLDSSTTLVLNADDPAVGTLTQTKAKKVFFGIEDSSLDLGKAPHAADYLSCTNCGGELSYERIYLSHLGVYTCPKCGLTRPKPHLFASSIKLNSLSGSEFILHLKEKTPVTSPLPGLYNIYNVLAAAAAASALGIDADLIKQAVNGFHAAFGRTERISVEGKKIYISLVKNPTGFNEVIRTVFDNKEKKVALIAINDLIADGRDVSWLWDVDFEQMKGRVQNILVSGIRGADMALRLKYANFENVQKNEDLEAALNKSLSLIDQGETLFLFPTYTAMLKIKSILAKRGYSGNFWEE